MKKVEKGEREERRQQQKRGKKSASDNRWLLPPKSLPFRPEKCAHNDKENWEICECSCCRIPYHLDHTGLPGDKWEFSTFMAQFVRLIALANRKESFELALNQAGIVFWHSDSHEGMSPGRLPRRRKNFLWIFSNKIISIEENLLLKRIS